jgi:hypothetical protein
MKSLKDLDDLIDKHREESMKHPNRIILNKIDYEKIIYYLGNYLSEKIHGHLINYKGIEVVVVKDGISCVCGD